MQCVQVGVEAPNPVKGERNPVSYDSVRCLPCHERALEGLPGLLWSSASLTLTLHGR